MDLNFNYTLLLNVDELWLKQGKRPYYMRAVKKHIAYVLQRDHKNDFNCYVENQRIVVQSDLVFTEHVIIALTNIPGIHSVAKAVPLPLDDAAIIPAVLAELGSIKEMPKTFAVKTHRVNKEFSKSSPSVSRDVGAAVLEKYPELKVDLKSPDLTITIKIAFQQIFVMLSIRPAIGGIPVGTSGHVVSLLSGGFDSPVASYLMSKRGCKVTMVFFHAYPFVGDEVKEKIKQLASVLGKFQMSCELYIVPFGDMQKIIAKECKKEYRTLLFRHYMIMASDQLAHRVRADALCMGDALSQVSSQTMQNIAILDRSIVRPILRPLIGFNKSEIIALSKFIGAHDISVLPQDDACSLLAPKHPVVKPYHPYWSYFTNQFPLLDEISLALDNSERIIIG